MKLKMRDNLLKMAFALETECYKDQERDITQIAKRMSGFPLLEELALKASITLLESKVNAAKRALEVEERILLETRKKWKEMKSARLPDVLWCQLCEFQNAFPCNKCKKNICVFCEEDDEDSDGWPTRTCPGCARIWY